MDTATEAKTVAGESSTTQQDIKGFMTVYMAKALQQGLSKITIEKRVENLKLLLKLGADLNSPLSVWQVIESQKWRDGTKQLAATAYKHFCKVFKINIPADLNFNKWQKTERVPHVPLESEIDQLIAACNPKTATFLQLLKETGIRSGETWRLKWLDFDFERKILTLNYTEKKGKPRTFKVSSKLTAMLNSLPKKSERIFGNRFLSGVEGDFSQQRKRAAQKLQNPRLLHIGFHTLRHWKATMEYHKTKNILYVQQLLGHKNIQNTMVYTQLIHFETDDFHSATAKTVGEAQKLIEAGFEYVCTHNETMLFRKRK